MVDNLPSFLVQRRKASFEASQGGLAQNTVVVVVRKALHLLV